MKEFLESYIETAFWSSTDDKDAPLDQDYGRGDLSPETLKAMNGDCEKFRTENSDLFTDKDGAAGHDFWLTRNGHGAGFWDGDWIEPDATTLTDNSSKFGTFELYIGDDGLIYHN